MSIGFAEVGIGMAKGGRQVQQDRFLFVPEERLMGVFDGHGSWGGKVADFALEWLRGSLSGHSAEGSSLRNEFQKIAAQLGELGEENGTTATVVKVEEKNDGELFLITDDIGDSPAFVFDPDLPLDHPDAIRELTIPHNTGNSKEVERMRKRGARRLGQFFGARLDDGELRLHELSRSIGDTETIPGIIAEPEGTITPAREGQLVVIGSDGAFAGTRKEMARDITMRQKAGKDLGQIARELAEIYANQTHDNATFGIARIGRYQEAAAS